MDAEITDDNDLFIEESSPDVVQPGLTTSRQTPSVDLPAVRFCLDRSFHRIDPLHRRNLRNRRQELYPEYIYSGAYRPRYFCGGWGGLFQFSNYCAGAKDFFLACSTVPRSLNILKFEKGCELTDPICRPSLHHHVPSIHDSDVCQLCWSMDNQFIYDSSRDKTVVKINVETGRLSSMVQTNKYGVPIDICVPRCNSHSSLLYFCTLDDYVVCWDSRLSGRNPNSLIEVNRHKSLSIDKQMENVRHPWMCCHMTHNDQIILCGSYYGQFTWWDIRMGRELCSVFDPQTEVFTSVQIGGNDRKVLAFSATTVYGFDQNFVLSQNQSSHSHSTNDDEQGTTTNTSGSASSGRSGDQTIQSIPGLKTYRGAENKLDLKKAHFSPDENYVIAGSDDGSVLIWDAHSTQVLYTISNLYDASRPYRVSSAQFAPIDSGVDVIALSTNRSSIFMFQQQHSIPVAASAAAAQQQEEKTYYTAEELSFPSDIMEAENEDDEAMLDEDEDWTNNPIAEENATECTYNLGYVDQVVFICLTCLDNGVYPAGLCEPCAKFCHRMRGHHIYNIGYKSMFRCDCGNSKFKDADCCLQPNKDPVNTHNHYNHNYKNEWCYCGHEEERPMFQCNSCEDWFHGHCIDVESIEGDVLYYYICESCLSNRLSFLSEYPPSRPDGDTDSTKIVLEGMPASRGRFIPSNFLSRISKQHRDELLRGENRQPQQPVNILVPKRKTPVATNGTNDAASSSSSSASSSSAPLPNNYETRELNKRKREVDEEEEIGDESDEEEEEDIDDQEEYITDDDEDDNDNGEEENEEGDDELME